MTTEKKTIPPKEKARFLFFQAVKKIVSYLYFMLGFAIFSAVFYYMFDLFILIIITAVLALPAIIYTATWWVKTIGYVQWATKKRSRQKHAKQQENDKKQDIQAGK